MFSIIVRLSRYKNNLWEFTDHSANRVKGLNLMPVLLSRPTLSKFIIIISNYLNSKNLNKKLFLIEVTEKNVFDY